MPIEVRIEAVQPVQGSSRPPSPGIAPSQAFKRPSFEASLSPDILQAPVAFPGSRNISPVEQEFNKLPRTLSLRRLGTNLVKNIAPYDISREPDRFRIGRRSPRAMCPECKRIYRIREGHPQCSAVKPGSGSANKIFSINFRGLKSPGFSKKAA